MSGRCPASQAREACGRQARPASGCRARQTLCTRGQRACSHQAGSVCRVQAGLAHSRVRIPSSILACTCHCGSISTPSPGAPTVPCSFPAVSRVFPCPVLGTRLRRAGSSRTRGTLGSRCSGQPASIPRTQSHAHSQQKHGCHRSWHPHPHAEQQHGDTHARAVAAALRSCSTGGGAAAAQAAHAADVPAEVRGGSGSSQLAPSVLRSAPRCACVLACAHVHVCLHARMHARCWSSNALHSNLRGLQDMTETFRHVHGLILQ